MESKVVHHNNKLGPVDMIHAHSYHYAYRAVRIV
jgi:hypothetical protein